jgi:CheY-like chemotaxis protein
VEDGDTPIPLLVAEDNVVNQQVSLRQLQQLGYTADVVANGNEVLHSLQRFSYDIALMDCEMPEMDGYETTAVIRQRDGIAKHTVHHRADCARPARGSRQMPTGRHGRLHQQAL